MLAYHSTINSTVSTQTEWPGRESLTILLVKILDQWECRFQQINQSTSSISICIIYAYSSIDYESMVTFHSSVCEYYYVCIT